MNATFRYQLFLPAFVGVLLAGACGLSMMGSGRSVQRTVPVDSFSGIHVSDGFDVDVIPGTSERVTVRVDDNLVDDLDIGVSDGTLRVALKTSRPVRQATLHAEIVARSITRVRGDGGATLRLGECLSPEALGLRLSGGSSVDGTVETKSLDLGMSGGSRANLRGNSSGLHISASGGSVVEAADLRVKDAAIELSGGARASTSVTTTMSADVSGGSSLRYLGTPSFVRRDVSGSSSITNA